ncbi:MAG: roadblock/LC7 domain-containing protein [Bdellovibrionales bacterium]|nr:roadblock/LC7 domain-containing protein [Bdellovibrionales bacterium]
MIMFDQEFKQISAIIERLNHEANAKVCYLVDKNGQLIASAGETAGIDSTSLASLTAGNIAATSGLAKLLGENEFSIVFHEGQRDNIHISLVGQRVILVVIFDSRTSLGLVRLKVRKISNELADIFNSLAQKAQSSGSQKTPFEEITDQDIDKLFSD